LIISYAKSQKLGDTTDTNSWFTHIIVYTNLLPISFYGIFDLCTIIEKFRFEITEKMSSNYKKHRTIINDADILTDLANINYVFLDKTGTLTSERVEISMIFAHEKIYEFDEEFRKKLKPVHIRSSVTKKDSPKSETRLKNMEEQLANRDIPSFQNLLLKRLKSSKVYSEENADFLINDEKMDKNTIKENSPKEKSPKENEQTFNNFTQFSISSKKNLHLSNLKESGEYFSTNLETEDALKELIRSFAFCHNAKVVYEGTDNCYFQSNRKEEEVLLEFARINGFCLEQVTKSDMKGDYLIKELDKKVNYGIIGSNEFSYKRKRFSLLMNEPSDEGSFLYCKGNLQAMRERLNLNEEEDENLNFISNYFKERGVKTMVYAVKKFNKEETKEISNKMRNLKFSLMTQEEEIEELANEMEVKMDLLGIVGFKEKMRKEVPKMINFLQEIDAGIWMVSGDTYDHVMNCAINSNILNMNKSEGFQVQSENIDDISVSIKNILMEIKTILDPFQQDSSENKEVRETFLNKKTSLNFRTGISIRKEDCFKNKYIVLNGKSFDIIMNNVYLRDHFIFIASFTKILIGYNLSPQNKQALVKIVKNNFYGNPNVLAIGDGLNDSPMMQSANVGIELMHKNQAKKYEIGNNNGDILISNLDQVKHLMIYKGKGFFERMDYLFGIIIYKEALLGFTFFMYNWTYNFNNHQLYESYYVLFYGHIFFFLQTIVFTLFNQSFKVKILKFFPALYMDGAQRMKTKFSKPFLKNFFEGLLISVMIIYVTSFSLGSSIDYNGKEVDFEALQWVFMFSLFFIIGIKVIFNSYLQNFFLYIFIYSFFIISNRKREMFGM